MTQPIIRPEKIRNYQISIRVLKESQSYLRDYGRKRYEGYMCWSGVIVGKEDALVRGCIYPKSYKESDFREAYAGLDIQVAFDIGNQIHYRGEFLLAQLHTHGFEAFHSKTDDTYPISHKVGFISIVIPFFARKKFYNTRTLTNCSVNEYLGRGKWKELEPKELRSRFIVTKEETPTGDF
jgi:hypothetical protein